MRNKIETLLKLILNFLSHYVLPVIVALVFCLFIDFVKTIISAGVNPVFVNVGTQGSKTLFDLVCGLHSNIVVMMMASFGAFLYMRCFFRTQMDVFKINIDFEENYFCDR